jgi:hypothetical protein
VAMAASTGAVGADSSSSGSARRARAAAAGHVLGGISCLGCHRLDTSLAVVGVSTTERGGREAHCLVSIRPRAIRGRASDEQFWRNDSREPPRPASASPMARKHGLHTVPERNGPTTTDWVSMRRIVSLALAVGAFRNKKGAT